MPLVRFYVRSVVVQMTSIQSGQSSGFDVLCRLQKRTQQFIQTRRLDLCILNAGFLQLCQHLLWRAPGLLQALRCFKRFRVVPQSIEVTAHGLAHVSVY